MGLAAAFDRPHGDWFSKQNENSLINILSPKTKRYLLSISRRPTSELFAFIEKNAQNIDDKFWQDLEVEYNRLFVGPYSPKAHPNESVYRNPYQQMLDECVFRLCEAYIREGFTVKNDFHGRPDHIVAELEFMVILCVRELEAQQNNNKEKTLEYLLKQYDFLVEHLGIWAPEFSNKIESSTGSLFYLSLAAVLRDVVSNDVELLRDEICKQEAKVVNSAANSRYEKYSTSPQSGKIKGERAGYRLKINTYDCILCEACARSCPTKAFRITNDEQSIRLLFKAALCSGCEQCLPICPQQAIKLLSGYDNRKTGLEHEWIEKAATKLSKCTGCGKDYSPDKMQQRLLASFSKDEYKEALFETLSLCTRCKRERLVESY